MVQQSLGVDTCVAGIPGVQVVKGITPLVDWDVLGGDVLLVAVIDWRSKRHSPLALFLWCLLHPALHRGGWTVRACRIHGDQDGCGGLPGFGAQEVEMLAHVPGMECKDVDSLSRLRAGVKLSWSCR